jgi:hypothetical protein
LTEPKREEPGDVMSEICNDDTEAIADRGPHRFKAAFWMVVLWIVVVFLAVFPFPWWWF